MFVHGLTGILIHIDEDSNTRYRFEVWFDYTRAAMRTISEGAMIAVPNFAGKDRETHYSILEVSGILPVHYALGDDPKGYPGFVVEAARNAGEDWVTQATTSTEDTTKIRCIAIPTNLEIVERPYDRREASTPTAAPVQSESGLPMVGHEVHLLDTETTQRIVNLAIDPAQENTVPAGTLIRDPQVEVSLRVEDLIKVHFGIFGFTGAGKSNLLSTLVRTLLTKSREPVKIVIFDLMGEYTGLLIDQLVDQDGACIVNVGVQAVPESVLAYYRYHQQQDAPPDQMREITVRRQSISSTRRFCPRH